MTLPTTTQVLSIGVLSPMGVQRGFSEIQPAREFVENYGVLAIEAEFLRQLPSESLANVRKFKVLGRAIRHECRTGHGLDNSCIVSTVVDEARKSIGLPKGA